MLKLTSRSLLEAFPHSVEWEEIIYLSRDPLPPCFYDWVVHLIERKQLKVKELELSEPSEELEQWMIENDIIPPAIHPHCWRVAPSICYALYKRGFKRIDSEVHYGHWKADLAGWNDKKQVIVVEVGSLSNLWKIFTTRQYPEIKEFWLYAEHNCMFIFTCKREEEVGYDAEAWEWWVEKIEELIKSKEGSKILRGQPCSKHKGHCFVKRHKRPCFEEVVRRMKETQERLKNAGIVL